MHKFSHKKILKIELKFFRFPIYCRFFNVNSIIKFSLSVFGCIGLIITVYGLFSEKLLNKVNNLTTQPIPPLQQSSTKVAVATTDALPSVETASESDGKERY